MKKETPKEYTIKVPVFTSERIKRNKDVFTTTYQQIVDGAKHKITEHNNYNANNRIITSDRRNKTIRKIIGNIVIHEKFFGDIPYLLLQISAYNTNWEGCLITSNETLQIENNDKIGSDNNFVMLYPHVLGIENQTIFWIILVYDDPKKDSFDNISTAKLVLTKILKQPVKCVKLSTILEELREGNILPQIKMNLNAINFDENNAGAKFEKYCTKSKLLRREEYEFDNMPFEDIEELIKSPFKKYKQRILKLIVKNKEYRITQDSTKDLQEGIDELAEQFFNISASVKEEDLKKIYYLDFVVSKLQYVLESYLVNGNDTLRQ